MMSEEAFVQAIFDAALQDGGIGAPSASGGPCGSPISRLRLWMTASRARLQTGKRHRQKSRPCAATCA